MSINICPMVALAAELTNVPLWLCIPFACLLLCIAIIPLVKGEWWEKYRPFAVIFWSLLFIIPFAVKYGAGTAAERGGLGAPPRPHPPRGGGDPGPGRPAGA